MGFRKWLIASRLGRSGKYISANGAKFYYETYGRGEPLFMFHGGLSTLETFRFQISEFSRFFKVILPERSGHGHSPDIEGAYSYERMADDMAAVIRQMGYSNVKVLGYSDGANLIIPLALKYPELVSRFVAVGANFHHRGCAEGFQEELRRIPEGGLPIEGIDEKYARYSPDGPEHFRVVFGKVKTLWLNEPRYTIEDIKKIRAPGLVLVGDKDMIDLDHTVAFYKALPEARLCVIPDATHRVIKEKPEEVNRLMLDFLKKTFDSTPPDFQKDILV